MKSKPITRDKTQALTPDPCPENRMIEKNKDELSRLSELTEWKTDLDLDLGVSSKLVGHVTG